MRSIENSESERMSACPRRVFSQVSFSLPLIQVCLLSVLVTEAATLVTRPDGATPRLGLSLSTGAISRRPRVAPVSPHFMSPQVNLDSIVSKQCEGCLSSCNVLNRLSGTIGLLLNGSRLEDQLLNLGQGSGLLRGHCGRGTFPPSLCPCALWSWNHVRVIFLQ